MFLVVNKKQILFFLIVVVSMLLLINIIAGGNKGTSISTNARNVYGELSNKVVVIDPGHGGFDPGKTGNNGENEKIINLAIALKLKNVLEHQGAVVIMTRENDDALGHTKREDLKKRIEYANRKDSNIFVSIHQNALMPSPNQYYGAQVFYHKSSEDGKELAENIQKSIVDGIKNGNKREIKAVNKEYYILRKTSIPAVIVECGFMSNIEEEKLLNDEKYQGKMAECIGNGIKKYLLKK